MNQNAAVPNENQADTRAVQAVLSGDRNAFREIVDRYTPVLYSLAYRMLGDAAAAEESVQEIFLQVYRSLGRYDQDRRFYTWMFTVAINYLRSFLRSRRWKNRGNVISFDESAGHSAADSESPGPEDDAVRREAERAVHDALVLLGMKYREVFVLREIEEIPVRETAVILGIPENTVKTLHRRAREQLKKILILRDWE